MDHQNNPGVCGLSWTRARVTARGRNGGHRRVFDYELRSGRADGLSITASPGASGAGSVIRLDWTAPDNLVLERAELVAACDLRGCLMLSNGFQSWSTSGELGARDRLPGVNRPASALFQFRQYGDYHFRRSSGKRGDISSYSYSYLRRDGVIRLFCCSLDETTGYTVIRGNFRAGTLGFEKDCQGLEAKRGGTLRLFEILVSDTADPAILDRCLARGSAQATERPAVSGWTSWYNYYTGISEDIVEKNLGALRKSGLPLDYFQIDDGYQESLGDWLTPNRKFPSGMEAVAGRVHAAGLKAGLWLAPFICEKRSTVFRKHPDWLLRDSRGRLVKGGWNPAWGNVFYVLDVLKPEVQAHLESVFRTVLADWRYDMVKLDFLYAAALVPRAGLTRAGVMTLAMDLLRRWVGHKEILGCGVPLWPAFGAVDYCRIGSDVAPYWEDRLLSLLRYRERVSTRNSLQSTLARYQLDGRAFRNDPDVFILRTAGNKLSPDQKRTLFLLNNILGGLVFFSDYVGDYGDDEWRLIRSMFPRIRADVRDVVERAGVYSVSFSAAGRDYTALANLTGKTVSAALPDGPHYGPESGPRAGPCSVTLRPHASECFARLSGTDAASKGGTSHIFPFADREAPAGALGTGSKE